MIQDERGLVMSLKLYFSLVFASMLLTSGLLPYLFNRREVSGARSLLYLTAFIDIWLVCQFLYLVSKMDSLKLFFHEAKFMGVEFAPVAMLIIAFEICGYETLLKRSVRLGLLIMPLLTLAVIATNSLHHLFRLQYVFEDHEGYRLIFPVNGIWYTINMYFLLTMVAVSMLLFLVHLFKAPARERVQYFVFFLAAGFPWTIGVIYHFVLKSELLVDITPLGLTITIVILIWGLFYHKMLNIIPIAGHEVYRNVQDGILVMDLKDHVLHMNPAARKLFNIPMEADVVGVHRDIYLRRIMVDPHQVMGVKGEFSVRSKEGVKVYSYRQNDLDYGKDKSVGIVMVFSDITQLDSLKKELESVYQEELIADDKKLVFISKMNKEIRKVLNPLVGNVDYLKQTALHKTEHQQIEMLSFSADMLLKLINDITDYTRIETGDLKLQAMDFNLHEVFWHVVQMYRLEAQKKGVQLHLQMDKEVPMAIHGDPLRLTQMVNNLVSNAVKFTPHGEVNVSVLAKQKTLVIQVTDTGLGIRKEAQDSFFDPYQQESDQISMSFGGTGLGLAIVKKLANLMGGSIELVSALDKGSQFTIRMPYQSSNLVKAKGVFADYKALVERCYQIVVISDGKQHTEVIDRYFRTCLKADPYFIGYEMDACDWARIQSADLLVVDMECHEKHAKRVIHQLQDYFENHACNGWFVGLTADINFKTILETDFFDEFLLMPVGFDKMNKVFTSLLMNPKQKTIE